MAAAAGAPASWPATSTARCWDPTWCSRSRRERAWRRSERPPWTVVICTGRMFGSARPRAAELGLRSGPIVCYGGALVADLESGEWLRHEPIDGDAAAALLRFARERGLHVNAYVDDALYVEEDDRWTRWTTGYAKVDVTLVDDLLPVVRARADEARDRGEARRGSRGRAGGVAAVRGRARAATSLPHFVEINAAGVSEGRHARVAPQRAAPRAAEPYRGLRRRPQRRGHARVGRRWAWRWRRAPRVPGGPLDCWSRARGLGELFVRLAAAPAACDGESAGRQSRRRRLEGGRRLRGAVVVAAGGRPPRRVP